MKKAGFAICCAIFLSVCQVVMVSALTSSQKAAIIDHCKEIEESLKTLQRNDARIRVNLGSRYETISSKYIVPLNVGLVENNTSNAGFVENQNLYAEAKKGFVADYVDYQQNLEELISIDCKNEPESFYAQLEKVRQKRHLVEKDVSKIRDIISKNVKLVTELKGKIK